MRARTKSLGTLEWLPGEKAAWRVPQQSLPGDPVAAEESLREALTGRLNAPLLSAAMSGTYLYAGANDGRTWISPDQGRSWRTWNFGENAPVARLVPDPNDGLTALAVIDNPSGPRVFRTLNGGLLWDDLTANLPDGVAPRSLAFDRATGTLYLATSKGLWMTWSNLQAPAAATPWIALGDALPGEAIADVKLDDLGNQLYVAVEGHGIFAANAPHRRRMPLIVHAADYQARPAAPGALLSVMGAAVTTARAATRAVPILAASTDESQVQIPFDVQGSALALTLNGFSRTLPLEPTSPSIFVDRDGAPMLIDADSGVILDAMNPARPGMRLQILAAGLGRVRPDWPAGVPAPLDNTPQVVAPVRVLIDRIPVDVVKATLAPGYVGFYLIEVQLPAFVNAGPAELFLESGGRESNRTRLWLQP
jgi:uncharacterized protein (TIGR03437 family)